MLCYQDTVKVPSCGYGSGNIDDSLQFLELLEFSVHCAGGIVILFPSSWLAIELGNDTVIFTQKLISADGVGGRA